MPSLLHGGTVLTKDYFQEQLERIREIRLSERRFYQKITDIYAIMSSSLLFRIIYSPSSLQASFELQNVQQRQVQYRFHQLEL